MKDNKVHTVVALERESSVSGSRTAVANLLELSVTYAVTVHTCHAFTTIVLELGAHNKRAEGP